MMDNTKKRFIIFLLLFIVGTLAGTFGYLNAKQKNAAQSDNVSVLPAPFFPTQKEPAKSYMQALLGADNPEELIIKDGCIRAGGFLLVWPYGFSLSADNGTFQVIDSTGQIVAHVGDKIKVGGGADETPDGRLARGYSAQLPSERCSGPYWIVGEGTTVDKSTSPVATTPTLKSAHLQYFPGWERKL